MRTEPPAKSWGRGSRGFGEPSPTHLGAINEIHHTPRRAEPKDTYFVTPIVDAPYSRRLKPQCTTAVLIRDFRLLDMLRPAPGA
ncbi:hypothetical protein [Streptomyces sp. NPDC052494]|uniref:hypothetical protein n=1 Tax=Streptomyces sp. NPDC052494 TaxID=3365692 RepID=UPI0037D372AD